MDSKFLTPKALQGIIGEILNFKEDYKAIEDYLNYLDSVYLKTNKNFYPRLLVEIEDKIKTEEIEIQSELNKLLILNPDFDLNEIKSDSRRERLDLLKKIKSLVKGRTPINSILLDILSKPFLVFKLRKHSDCMDQLQESFMVYNPPKNVTDKATFWGLPPGEELTSEDIISYIPPIGEIDSKFKIDLRKEWEDTGMELIKLRNLQIEIQEFLPDSKEYKEIERKIYSIVNKLSARYFGTELKNLEPSKPPAYEKEVEELKERIEDIKELLLEQKFTIPQSNEVGNIENFEKEKPESEKQSSISDFQEMFRANDLYENFMAYLRKKKLINEQTKWIEYDEDINEARKKFSSIFWGLFHLITSTGDKEIYFLKFTLKSHLPNRPNKRLFIDLVYNHFSIREDLIGWSKETFKRINPIVEDLEKHDISKYSKELKKVFGI